MAQVLIRGGLLVCDAAAEPRSDAALLVEDGLIVEIGDAALRLAADGAPRLDYPGRVIAPGLIDSHVHLMWSGAGIENGVDPMYARSNSRPPASRRARWPTCRRR